MNKTLLIGRLVRDPDVNTTNSGIKYTRFTIAVNRQFGEDQADFIPIVAWRNSAEFVGNYLKKGSLVSVEGRFTSSTYQNQEGQNITRYEITADRVDSLETKAQAEHRKNSSQEIKTTSSNNITFEVEENKPKEDVAADVPWELDL